jgi:hypothetical protein
MDAWAAECTAPVLPFGYFVVLSAGFSQFVLQVRHGLEKV